MKQIGITFAVLIMYLGLHAQNANTNIEQKFADAGYFFSNEDYEKALPIYQALYKTDSSNANLAYRIGVCYVNMPLKLFQSIPFLQKACKTIAIKINEESYKERNAPLEAQYYLGLAYQLAHEFDKAIEQYENFVKQTAKDERQLTDPSKRAVAACIVAKDLYKKPKEVEISNIGKVINTEFNDLSPCVTKDDSLMIFTIRTKRNTSVDDITMYRFQVMQSKKQANGQWARPTDITDKLASKGTAQTVSISADGKTLFLYRDDYYYGNVGDVTGGNIYVSYFDKGHWTPMKRFNELNSRGDDRHASISDDGNTIYFSSDRKGGIGGLDIYRIDKQANGKWSEAINLGTSINTPDDDTSPFPVADSVLYFCSEGHSNIGGFDVFKCSLSAQKKWNKPTNLGVPINSPGDESFFVPVLNGQAAYFATARPDGYLSFGGTDIYNIILKIIKTGDISDEQNSSIVEIK